MLQDSKTKIEVIRMQILQAVQTNELAFDNGETLERKPFTKTFLESSNTKLSPELFKKSHTTPRPDQCSVSLSLPPLV